MSPRDLAGYVFLALVWGLSFLVLVRVVDAFGWVGAVTFRCILAAIFLYLLARALGRRLDFGFPLRHGLMVGATTVAGQLVGLSYATPIIGTAMAAILVATIPLFSMLISRLWGLETFDGRKLAGLALGFAGVILLVGFPAVPFTPLFAIGCLDSMASALCAAFGSVYASRHLRAAGSWEVTMLAFLAGGIMALPLILLVPVPGPLVPMDFLYLLVLGGGMSGLTYVVYFGLVASIGATRTISVEFAVTVVAVLIGALWLGEKLSWPQLAGGGTIMAGCMLVLGLWPARRPA
ncbi:DMT family transporter [Rhabdaerophilum sp. SD176]|uniref:DMT family transporter n=1 Tax=Rhabdaerophilum sp. SD176 TaxID=2983548 RepID=UPI0024DFDB93|nr:DMT family transporter [Rhabdaerophilum sp. SD176]